MNNTVRGIDISHWQGKFDWSAAKSEGIRFAVIKGGELVAVSDIDEVKGTSSLEDVFMELTEK